MQKDDYYSKLRKQLDERLNKDTRLTAIAEKIKSKTANFNDTTQYSEIVSNHISAVIKNNIGKVYNLEHVCKALLRDHYTAINDVLGEVQVSLDSRNGIHIAPQKAPFPAERVTQVAHALEDTTVPLETIVRRAGAPVENVAKSFHDDYMKKNAEFRSDAGLKCYINRVTDGKCCEWCNRLAGRYTYGEEPHDVFRRHDNCGCTVTYECGRQRQDVWSKKSWEVPQIGNKKYKPTVFDNEQAKTLEKKNLQYKGLTSVTDSVKIRNIKLDDVKDAIKNSEISEDVAKTVFDALGENNERYLFDDVAVVRLDSGIVMQTDPVRKGTFFDIRLNLNENFLGGKTVKQIDEQMKNTDYTVANSLREAVIHEKYHAKLISGLNQSQLESLYDTLSDYHFDGISPTAWKDGSECIAEIGVLFERGETDDLPQHAKDLFNRYIGGI